MNYQGALKYILFRTDYERGPRPPYKERHYRLDRVRDLLAAVGNPQEHFDTLHIGGTKGKGSTTAMLETVLRTAGYSTGMYTSPHLHTFRERIQANGKLISEAQLIELTLELREALETRPQVTVFETITALAFMFLARQNVQIAAVEVGLGGRLDATNVLSPLCAVITSISLDHINVLGHTLGEIAGEKAGIIKQETPVIVAPQRDAATKVLSRQAAEVGAPLIQVGKDWTFEILDRSLTGQVVNVRHGNEVPYKELWVPLVGDHQAENAVSAIAALETIREQYPVDNTALRDGFRSLRWPGRFEVLSSAPLVIADGAHNPYSCTKLLQTIQALEPGKKIHLVFGASSGHQPEELLRVLATEAGTIHLVKAAHARATDVDALETGLRAIHLKAKSKGTVSEGVAKAINLADQDDLILITGSLFVVAEAREYVLQEQGTPLEKDPPGTY